MAAEAGRADSPFLSWNDVERFEFAPGVRIKAAGGEQVCVCHVKYDAGKQVPLHSHEHTEQVMVILEGDVTVTVDGEARSLGPGDVCVINRGREHSVYSEGGVVFLEALAPVPLDHIPDRQRDLVLGPDGGSGHVER
jgi:mannose-6-phosphate isomerase-like protein (cupin superfamily)